jgi:hypothetical protein
MCEVKEKPVIFDVYVPGPQTPVSRVIWHLTRQLKAARKSPPLAAAIMDLRYGFALVVPIESRRKTLMDAVRTPEPNEKIPLIERVRIWVEAQEDLGAIFGTAGKSLGSALALQR